MNTHYNYCRIQVSVDLQCYPLLLHQQIKAIVGIYAHLLNYIEITQVASVCASRSLLLCGLHSVSQSCQFPL